MLATHINFRWLTGANLGNLTSGSGVPSGPAKAGYGWGLIEFDLTSLGIGKIYIDDIHLMDH